MYLRGYTSILLSKTYRKMHATARTYMQHQHNKHTLVAATKLASWTVENPRTVVISIWTMRMVVMYAKAIRPPQAVAVTCSICRNINSM